MSEVSKKYTKRWIDVELDVEKEIQKRYAMAGKDRIKSLGVDGDSSASSEKRAWMAIYVQMLSWKSKCRELHGLLNTSEQLGKSTRAKGRPSAENIKKKEDLDALVKLAKQKSSRERKKKK